MTDSDITAELVEARRKIYGEPTETYPRTAQVWSGILGHEVSAYDVVLCMIGFKAVRAAVSPDYSDNSDDIEGYLAIFRELVGPDMVQARSVAEYAEKLKQRVPLLQMNQSETVTVEQMAEVLRPMGWVAEPITVTDPADSGSADEVEGIVIHPDVSATQPHGNREGWPVIDPPDHCPICESVSKRHRYWVSSMGGECHDPWHLS